MVKEKQQYPLFRIESDYLGLFALVLYTTEDTSYVLTFGTIKECHAFLIQVQDSRCWGDPGACAAADRTGLPRRPQREVEVFLERIRTDGVDERYRAFEAYCKMRARIDRITQPDHG
jgi:hypothetical protein